MEDKTEADCQGGASIEAVKKQIYHLKGPRWRSRLHSGSKSIGVPDLYMHRANVAEDDISETAVKNGFSIPQMVGNETFSAHDMIFDRLKAKELLSQIGSLFHEVNLRREEICNHRNAAGPLQSRPPQRVTLNEVKLAAYVKELADPSVPLKKLARSVPHGYRGERMLEMLWNGGNLTQAMAAIKAQSSATTSTSTTTRSVTIERAVWFVRVVGSSELTSSRARQGNGSSYTAEWTAVVMLWLRRQIVELNVIQSTVATPTTPSSPAATVTTTSNRTSGPASNKMVFSTTSHQEGHYSLLLEDDFRSRWVAKWHYSLMLLRGLCHEYLVDPQAVVKAALEMLRTANLAQLSFALALVQEVLEVVYSSAVLVDQSLDTLCTKLVDLKLTLEEGRFGEGICKELESIIVNIVTRRPDALVNSTRWEKHKDILSLLMKSSTLSKEMLDSVVHRNKKLLCGLLDQHQLDLPMSKQQTDVAILDRVTVNLSVEDAFLELFASGRQSSSSEKLRSILLWSTTSWRCGIHRPFAGAQLLNLFSQAKDSKMKRYGKSIISLQKIDLGTFLLKWISEVESAMQQNGQSEGTSRSMMAAIQSVDIASLIVLIGEAIRLGAFSYPKYLQRLTARGLTAAQSRDDKSSTTEFLHAKVMRSVPLASASVSLEHQRRVAIYGNRIKESWEEAMQRRASKEVSNAFDWSTSSNSIDWNSEEPLRHFWSSSRFVQNRVIQGHFMAYFRQSGNFQPLTPSCIVQVSQFLAKANDFASLYEILVILFERRQQVNSSLISICFDIAIEHRLVWISMGVPLLQQFGVSVFPSHNAKSRTPQMYTFEAEAKLQESVRTYLQGNHTQASLLLGEVTSLESTSIGSLACSAFFASAVVLHETKQEMNGALATINWIKLVPAAIGSTWDSSWQEAIVDSLSTNQSVVHEMNKAFFQILVQLLECNMLPADELLRHYLVPCLQQGVASSNSMSIQTALDLARALLLNEIDDDDCNLLLLARFRCIRSTLVASDTIKDLLSIIVSLVLLEGQESKQINPSIKQALCQEPLIRLQFQANLSDLCNYLEERLSGDSLSNTVVSLLPTQSTLLLENALEVDYQGVIEDTSDWLCQQRLFELSVLVYRLDNMESSQQHRSQSKIQTIARLSIERWFRVSTIKQCGLPLVTRSRSASFAKAINEELLKRVQSTLYQGTKEDVMESIQCAIYLMRSSQKSKLPSLTVSSSLFSSISEWLGVSKDSWEEDLEDIADREEKLGLRLAILCLLLRFDGIWTVPTKATALQLIFALLSQAVTLSCQGQTRDAVVNQILDVTAYCLQEMPADIRQTVQNMADTVVNMVHQAMPEENVANRILFFFNRLPSVPVNSMVLATSGSAAFVSGRLHSVMKKPWELYNNVEALDYYLQTQQQLQQNKDKEEVDSTFAPLVNNGPISLEFVSAKKTRDRLPLADVQVDSEKSYGLGWGGEPSFARDLRRGLLNLQSDELLPRREKEQEKLEDVVEIPEKKKTSKKRSEPASATSTRQTAAASKKKARKR